MGFLDSMNLDDALEPTAVPGGAEYKLRIVDVKTDPSFDDGMPRNKNNEPYLLPRLQILDQPGNPKEFTKYIGLAPDSLWKMNQFLKAFDMDADSLDQPTDMVGSEGWAILGHEESDEWGEQNFVKKFIIPK